MLYDDTFVLWAYMDVCMYLWDGDDVCMVYIDMICDGLILMDVYTFVYAFMECMCMDVCLWCDGCNVK